MKRVLFQSGVIVRQTNMKVIDRLCRIYNIKIVSAGWKGLTVEKFDMFIGDNFVGTYSIFH